MKLELKHLVPYLHHKLKVEIKYGHENKILLLEGIYRNGLLIFHGFEPNARYMHNVERNVEECKPILRPFSDLNKEIIIDGVKVIPIQEAVWGKVGVNHMGLRISFECFDDDVYMICRDKQNRMIDRAVNTSDFDFLYKYHFDVFGLIEKGLAIDINTLK